MGLRIHAWNPLISVCFVGASLGSVDSDDLDIEPYIHNGQNVKQGEYPFVVAFKRPNYTDCAGTILTKDWILTGGGCCF